MKTSHSNVLGDGSLGCPDCGGLSDVINSDFAKVKILERFPKSGQPAPGVPFSVKIEVQTYRSGGDFWRTPFACLDAFVVARGLYQHRNKILASSFVRTDALRSCRGTATLTFDKDFRAGKTDWVQFEIYKGGTQEWFEDKTTLQMIKNGDAELVGTSEPMRFNASQSQLVNAGVIEEPSGNLFSETLGAFGGPAKTIKSLTLLLAVGAGGYLIWKNGDAIQEYVKNLADEVSNEGVAKVARKKVGNASKN